MIPFIHRGIAILLLLFSLVVPESLRAEPYFPSQPLLILTQMQSIESGDAGDQTRQYTVASMPDASGVQFLNFSSPSSNQLFCRISFHNDGSLSWQKTANSLPQALSQTIFLQPGFPLPVDILPVAKQPEAKKIYAIQTNSGGRAFKASYTVEKTEINIDTVRKNDWLKMNIPSDAALQLFTVTDAKQQVISIQLWPEQGEWWLYEETPFRKSWRIE